MSGRNPSDGDKGNLTVNVNFDEEVSSYRIKRSRNLQKLVDVFCEKRSLDQDEIVFLFNGVQIKKNKTVEENGLEDGDEILAVKKSGSSETNSQGKDSLKLKVQFNKDGSKTCFRIKRKAKMQKLMDAFCKKRSMDPGAIRFVFDGCLMDKNKTAAELGMEDEDEIDVFVQVDGGGPC